MPETETGTTQDLDTVLAVLRRSHDALVAALTPLTAQELSGPSYDRDGSLAQVASHLGSGAEVFVLLLDAGLRQEPAPGVEQFQPVWARWDAKPASAQGADALAADAAFLDRVDALSPEQRRGWRLALFGSEQDLVGLLRMRLGEHAVHTWDIAVAARPAAVLAEDAVAVIVDSLAALVERTGKPASEPLAVEVRTAGPHRHFLLELTGEGARLGARDPAGPAASAVLRLPAEAFTRLVYGRLDPDHTPADVQTDGVDLETLRAAFPGF